MNRAQGILEEMLMEPPKEVWFKNELKCVVWRHPTLFHYCGYVGVKDKTSPLWELGYDDIYDLTDIKVHFGLTFSGFLDGDNKEFWSFGFDCAHIGDITGSDCFRVIESQNSTYTLDPSARYRNFNWVKKETERLCNQISELLNNQYLRS